MDMFDSWLACYARDGDVLNDCMQETGGAKDSQNVADVSTLRAHRETPHGHSAPQQEADVGDGVVVEDTYLLHDNVFEYQQYLVSSVEASTSAAEVEGEILR